MTLRQMYQQQVNDAKRDLAKARVNKDRRGIVVHSVSLQSAKSRLMTCIEEHRRFVRR